MPQNSSPKPELRWTDRQAQYLAFIHDYTKVNRQSPAETDIARFFGLAPPSVHRMIVELEQRGLITRTAGAARSIRVVVRRADLPELE
jgi:DNA-binding MarR family transcriptional regulator